MNGIDEIEAKIFAIEAKISATEAEISATKTQLASAISAGKDNLIGIYGNYLIALTNNLIELRKENNILLTGAAAATAAEIALASTRPLSPQHFDKIFVIAQATNDSRYVELLGTCFAITTRHIITAYHNLTDETGNTTGSTTNPYQIARIARKVSDKDSLDNPLVVTFCEGEAIDDWAILELADPLEQFANFFPVCGYSDLPDISMKAELKSFYSPIGQYRRNSFRELKIWRDDYKPVLQYEEKKILLDGGLYRGSCGAPYIDRDNKVVALHLSSMHEGQDISVTKKKRTLKNLEEFMTDQSDIHNSIREGLVLASVPNILAFIASH